MADRTYRNRDRSRYERPRQAEQFESEGYDWRDEEEHSYSQMGEGGRDAYGQIDTGYGDRAERWDRGRERGYGAPHDFTHGADERFGGSDYGPARYAPGGGRSFRSFTGSDYGGRDFSLGAGGYGAGSRLAANHGEWRESRDAAPSRDYRRTWGAFGDSDGRGWFDLAADTVAGWFSDDEDDQRRRGYRGRGPANYTRSDERIMEDACDALTDDWGIDACEVQVSVANGEVTLDGTVPSRAQKRRAEDCVEDLSGVSHVQNNLRVDESRRWDREREASRNRDAEITG